MNQPARSMVENVSARPGGQSARGAEVFAHAMRHSRRVRILKIVLPVAAIAISAVFFGYSILVPDNIAGVSLDSTSVEEGRLVMQNPALNGFTRENLPYRVTAAVARQPIGSGEGAIDLEEIEARLPLDAQNEAVIRAGGGILDRAASTLYLDKDITVTTSTGITAQLRSAVVNIAEKGITSDEPVQILLDGMSVRADSFRAAEGGTKLVFERNVRVEIDPARLRQREENIGQ